MTTRRAILATLVVAMALGGVLAGLATSGVFSRDSNQKPAEKVAIETELAARQATVDAEPRIPKYPSGYTPMPTPTSCPIDPKNYPARLASPLAYGADPSTYDPDIFGTRDNPLITLTSQAGGLTTDGAPWGIYSGASTSDAQQGIIVTWVGAKDPCAEGGEHHKPVVILTPFKRGAVLLVKVNGDTVEFKTTGGTTGRLNFVTGKFE